MINILTKLRFSHRRTTREWAFTDTRIWPFCCCDLNAVVTQSFFSPATGSTCEI